MACVGDTCAGGAREIRGTLGEMLPAGKDGQRLDNDVLLGERGHSARGRVECGGAGAGGQGAGGQHILGRSYRKSSGTLPALLLTTEARGSKPARCS